MTNAILPVSTPGLKKIRPTKDLQKSPCWQKKSSVLSQPRIASVDRVNSGRRNPVRISTASSIRRSFEMAIPTPVNGQITYENAVSAQQQLGISSQAATNQGVIQIYSIDTMADAVATSKIAQSDVPDNMLSLLTTLQAVKS
jgi:hypothetical protein